jgi:hypothetical protein
MTRPFIVFLLLSTICIQSADDLRHATYTRLDCTLKPLHRSGAHHSHPNIPGPITSQRASGKTIIESSNNWAGYVAMSDTKRPAKHSVSNVTGSWTVPTVRPSTRNSYSAFWIGIDGYTSQSVEQIGTGHDWINGSVKHYAWFEMYPRNSYAIESFPLEQGDIISATIAYTNNGIFVMTIYNDTKRTYATIPTSYTTSTTAHRNSAEWIVEAPYNNGILPLAQFGTGHLTHCTATINGATKGLGRCATIALMMIDDRHKTKAVTSAVLADKESFFVTWQSE